MRAFALLFAVVSAGACAGSDELVRRSDVHLRNAQAAAAAGDQAQAEREERKAFHDYERAASRAYLEGRSVPDPPPTPPPLPVRSVF